MDSFDLPFTRNRESRGGLVWVHCGLIWPRCCYRRDGGRSGGRTLVVQLVRSGQEWQYLYFGCIWLHFVAFPNFLTLTCLARGRRDLPGAGMRGSRLHGNDEGGEPWPYLALFGPRLLLAEHWK